MDYFPARRIILGYGWEPMIGPCEAVEDSECGSFPEIDTCSGVSPGYCHMVFMRRNECLDVGTSGGEPVAGQEQSDTHVTDVSFRHGRCWRAAFEAFAVTIAVQQAARRAHEIILREERLSFLFLGS